MVGLNAHNFRELARIVVAVVGLLMVAFAEDYTMPILELPADGFWVNGFVGLSLILVGTLIVVVKR
jgi:hypothetical protein